MSLSHDLNVDAGVRLAAAKVLIRFGRKEEGKAILRELANPTSEIKNTFEIYEEIRWGAVEALCPFPEERPLIEQASVELARHGTYEKVRILAVERLKEHKQVSMLLDIGSNCSIPPSIRKHVGVVLMQLGRQQEAEAITQDMGPTLGEGSQ